MAQRQLLQSVTIVVYTSDGPKVRVEPYDLRLHLVQALLAREQSLRVPQAGRTTDKRGILYGRIGRPGFTFNYVTLRNKTRVALGPEIPLRPISRTETTFLRGD
jgi:hypothetical protein